MAVPRNYHSVANLLPDGRIFSGGGGLCGDCATNHFDGAIFTPPYLLNPDGTQRPRPVITNTPPATAGYGATLTVTTSTPVTAFSLVRTGAATHSTDNDQRRVPLTSHQVSTGVYELTVPTDPGVALPGSYLLFALDAAGVPSIAKTITIGWPPSPHRPCDVYKTSTTSRAWLPADRPGSGFSRPVHPSGGRRGGSSSAG
ncbi:DUF1929 domain-containing protein [Streptomyces sp. RKAG337]|nr:DUF1929 domain-containing protein [Streptomyces sp. RKAG337]